MSDGIQAAEERVAALLARLEVAVNAAETANQKANSEAAFAFNAKGMAEEHAKSISQTKGAVDVEYAALQTIKKGAEDAAGTVSASRVNSDANAQAIAEKRAQTEKDAAAARTASEQGAASLDVIENTKAQVAAMHAEGTQLVSSIKGSKEAVDQNLAAIQKARQDITVLATQAGTEAAELTQMNAEAKKIYPAFQQVVNVANDAQVKVAEYEQKLAALIEDYTALDKKIEGLLPHATSASLASAFREQKKRFEKPQRNWMIAFGITIFLLLLVGLVGAPKVSDKDTWDVILRHLTSRLPLIVPLLWLGIYAGRNYMLALRLEEEYAFKEAISTSFEGYKREMADIPAGNTTESKPISVLCENVLLALSQRPGRIYEGRHDDITPFSPIKGMFGLKPTKKKVGDAEKPGAEE